MSEVRCNLDWTGRWPKIVLAIEAELTEVQVRELAGVVCQTVEHKLACLLECGGGCPKEGEGGTGNSGNRQTQH